MRTLTATASLKRAAALVALAVAPLAPPAAATTPCEEADRLLEAGHVLQAEERYGNLAREKESASQDCARQGLLRAAGARCEAAERLMRSDRTDEAKKAYDAVLEKFPTLECALAGVERIAHRARAAARSCEAADELADRRLDAEAKDAYKKILEAAPGTPCAIAGLDRLAAPYALRWARRTVDEIGAGALVVFAEVAGLVLVLFLFVRWVRLAHPRTLKLDIDKVSAGGSGFEAGPCEQILALIEHELEQLERRPRFTSPTLIDGPVETPPTLPDLTALSKGTNVLRNALLALVPTRTVSLSAVLLDAGSGNGLLLRLVYQPTKELWGSVVLKDAEGGTAAASGASSGPGPAPGDAKAAAAAGYARLAHAAAAWACWTIHEQTAHPRQYRGKSCLEAGCTEMRRAFGTASWRSYWKGAVGASDRKRDPARAKRGLREALVRDPENRLALYNLAALEVADRAPELERDKRLYARLHKYLEKARVRPDEQEQQQAQGNARFDAIRMLSDFHLGGIAFYRQFAFDPSSRRATLLLRVANEHFRRSEETARASPEQAGEVALDARIARATCLRMLHEDDEALVVLGSCGSEVLSAGSLLNLACFYSNPEPEPGSGGDLERARQYLHEALEADPSIAKWADKDPALRRLRRYLDLVQEAQAQREAVASE